MVQICLKKVVKQLFSAVKNKDTSGTSPLDIATERQRQIMLEIKPDREVKVTEREQLNTSVGSELKRAVADYHQGLNTYHLNSLAVIYKPVAARVSYLHVLFVYT